MDCIIDPSKLNCCVTPDENYNGTIIVCSSSSAVTITVPVSLPSVFNCMIIQSGSGQVSLSASSTTLNNRNGRSPAGQYAIMTLVHLGSNVFVVSGDTAS